jgi:nucleotide-binding universal stress UspA family protein
MGLHSRIFVAIDGGSTQEFVSRKALEVADQNEAELIFGHVIDSVPYEASGVDFEELCAEMRKCIETDLADVFEEANNNPRIKSVELKVRAGRVNDTLITRLIEPCEPDLVICGERGLSNFKYAFVGSVSSSLVRGVECDVLVVKTEANAARNAPQ